MWSNLNPFILLGSLKLFNLFTREVLTIATVGKKVQSFNEAILLSSHSLPGVFLNLEKQNSIYWISLKRAVQLSKEMQGVPAVDNFFKVKSEVKERNIIGKLDILA